MEKLPIWETSPALRLIVFNRQPDRPSPANRMTYSSHSHSFFELGIVLAGECAWKLDRRRRLTLRAGQSILVKPGSRHAEEPSAERETKLAWLGFDFADTAPEWSEQVVTLGGDLPEVAHSFHVIYREHSASDSLTRRRVALALQNVLVLVSRCAESGGVTRPKQDGALGKSDLNARQVRSVESSAHYFRHNFQESLSIAQVAAYHSFCPAYFSTLFRRHYRVSPRTFLQRAKIEKAVELLTTSDLTLKEISDRCGFVDAAHLSKAFKQRHRLTPGAFRIRARA
jgi:AraC-like DNA-binding protein